MSSGRWSLLLKRVSYDSDGRHLSVNGFYDMCSAGHFSVTIPVRLRWLFHRSHAVDFILNTLPLPLVTMMCISAPTKCLFSNTTHVAFCIIIARPSYIHRTEHVLLLSSAALTSSVLSSPSLTYLHTVPSPHRPPVSSRLHLVARVLHTLIPYFCALIVHIDPPPPDSHLRRSRGLLVQLSLLSLMFKRS